MSNPPLTAGLRVVFTEDLSRASLRSLAGTVTEVIEQFRVGPRVWVQWDDGELAIEDPRTLVAL
jgi:hypothetical protein